jgi:hypothetical protein
MANFYAGDWRSIPVMAVGKFAYDGDDPRRYRPHDKPVTKRSNDDAGDASGISRGASGETSVIAFSVVQPHRVEVLKAASNAFVAEEMIAGPTE